MEENMRVWVDSELKDFPRCNDSGIGGNGEQVIEGEGGEKVKGGSQRNRIVEMVKNDDEFFGPRRGIPPYSSHKFNFIYSAH